METYHDIIREIKELDEKKAPANAYLNRHEIKRSFFYESNSTPYALDIAKRVRDAVAGDASEWYVTLRYGEKLHLGEDYIDEDGNRKKARAFARKIIVSGGDLQFDNSDTCKKIEPDTQEMIYKDILLKTKDYCEKYGLSEISDPARVCHLLERQKKLDRGV